MKDLMKELRPEIQAFMRSCERLFGFAHLNGGLTSEECQALSYYAQELDKELSPFCGQPQDKLQANKCSGA